MLRNQLALTEGLRANQRAITQGFNQLERLADMQELPSIEVNNQEQSGTEQSRKTPTIYDIERPNDFFNTNTKRLQEIYAEVTNDKNKFKFKFNNSFYQCTK